MLKTLRMKKNVGSSSLPLGSPLTFPDLSPSFAVLPGTFRWLIVVFVSLQLMGPFGEEKAEKLRDKTRETLK
jgi:hypothetical protein